MPNTRSRIQTKADEELAFWISAFNISECCVQIEKLMPFQIARMCRPNRPSKTRPRRPPEPVAFEEVTDSNHEG